MMMTQFKQFSERRDMEEFVSMVDQSQNPLLKRRRKSDKCSNNIMKWFQLWRKIKIT
ncbi:uncharacterized protein DS421_11g331770 [Arachis hypogaea]|nr:uncharacterized protein DS421_11g331770 [Arachis hypogaea]